jgi:hypothetical protein
VAAVPIASKKKKKNKPTLLQARRLRVQSPDEVDFLN